MSIFLFLSFALFAFYISSLLAGDSEGDKVERSIRFEIRDHYIHFHHWLWSLGAIGFLYYFGFHAPYAYGFAAGSVAHGFTYKDWPFLVYHKDRMRERWERWRENR